MAGKPVRLKGALKLVRRRAASSAWLFSMGSAASGVAGVANTVAPSSKRSNRLRQQQRIWRRRLERLLEGGTVLATPATPLAALPIENSEALEAARRLTSFSAPFNLTGLPAISVPCGFTAGGLPAGLQLVGRPWAEALVLQVADQYERATEWRGARPRLAS